MRIAARNARDWPSCVQRFVISGGKLGNRCKECPGLALWRASIRDFGPGLANQCSGKSSACSGRGGNEVRVRFYSSLPQRRMVSPAECHYPTATAIPDFRGQTWQSLQGYARLRPPACSDSGFQGSNLRIAARNARDWPSCVQRFVISGPNLGIAARLCPFTTSCVQ